MATVTEVRAGVWRIELGVVNVYVLDDDVPTLVDAGTPLDAGAIRDGLHAAGFSVGDIRRVLLTHYDVDHVGALSALAPEMDATVVAGELDAALLRRDERPPLSNHKGILQRMADVVVPRPDLPVEGLADGESVGSVTAYHTPGHTPGHVAYVSEDLDVALVGDLVTESGGVLRPAHWMIDYDDGRTRESIRTLVAEAPPFGMICPGHGEPIVGDVRDALVQATTRSGIPI